MDAFARGEISGMMKAGMALEDIVKLVKKKDGSSPCLGRARARTRARTRARSLDLGRANLICAGVRTRCAGHTWGNGVCKDSA